jgi:hypothetical protein
LIKAAQQWNPNIRSLDDWNNGSLYTQTKEVFGILSISEALCAKVHLTAFNVEDLQPIRQRYLASRQGTRFAVTVVHTLEEKALYHEYMHTVHAFMQDHPDWTHCAQIWNSKADGMTIFYKVTFLCMYWFDVLTTWQFADHLEAYNAHWSANQNAHASLALSAPKRANLDRTILVSSRVDHQKFPQVLVPQPLIVPGGQLQGINQIVHSHTTTASSHSSQIPPAMGTQRTLFGGTVMASSSRAQAKVRHCRKCGKESCKGRGGPQHCRNVCQDCHKAVCPGRKHKARACPGME